MYILVLILVQFGEHKIVSNQVLYPTEAACDVRRVSALVELNATKPEPNALAIGRCIKLEPNNSV